MARRNFPGIYTSVVDKSQFNAPQSRFRVGLIGPATAGPINVVTPIQSSRDFVRMFGDSPEGTYLAAAVQLVSERSDGVSVVRVAHQYEILGGSGSAATGVSGATQVFTPNTAYFRAADYVRVSQIGIPTTVNAKVLSVGSNSLTLDTALAGNYSAASIDRSRVTSDQGDPALAVNAANNAEAFVYVPNWASTPVGGTGTEVKVSGEKSEFQVEVAPANQSAVFGGSPQLAVGDIVKIDQTGLVTSLELMVRELVQPVPGANGIIKFEPVNKADIGFTAVPLQDSYTDATITKLHSSTPHVLGFHFMAANPGTWANSDGARIGLVAKVVPGSNPGSKKLQVILNSDLVEEIDNLSASTTIINTLGATVANPNFIATKINTASAYVRIALADSTDVTSGWLGSGDIALPSNTRDGWKSTSTPVNIIAFSKGFNGENLVDSDYIGTVDGETEIPTGLKIFEDSDNNLQLDVIAAPGVSSVNVAMEMDRICRSINAAAVFDAPKGLNARKATDWHNGIGAYTGNGKLDTYTIALFWNWFTIVDSISGNRITVPPSCGALRALAYTFDAYKPWFAAAGETRGLIPEALTVEFTRVSEDAKQSMYGAGNALNPIIVNRQRIMVFGNRTAQRSETKLSGFNNVVLVNTVVRGLAERGRKYVFDPIDDILVAQLDTDFRDFLQSVVNDRGLEDFSLSIDASAENRNNRQVIVQVSIVPVDAMEKMFINATVRESGAILNSVQ